MQTENMISKLSFDKELVTNLEQKKLDLDVLYVYLMNGKISIREYLYLCGVRN